MYTMFIIHQLIKQNNQRNKMSEYRFMKWLLKYLQLHIFWSSLQMKDNGGEVINDMNARSSTAVRIRPFKTGNNS